MSLPIWTPAALSSSAGPYAGTAWRLVEAQHRVSTLRLVDNLAEQRLLEEILNASKPVVPAECQGLWPNSRPIRGSRARGDDFERGQRFKTATAELGWKADWRLLYRGLCQGTSDVICRREAALLNLDERSRAVRGQSQTLLLGMRSCHTGVALLFGVGAVTAP